MRGTVTAWPFPLLMKGRHGYSEPYRWKISGEARHCCHACPDLSHSGRRTVATMAYLYGSEMADPPVSESIEDGGYAPKAAPWESAPQSRPASPTGPRRHQPDKTGSNDSDRPIDGGIVATTQ